MTVTIDGTLGIDKVAPDALAGTLKVSDIKPGEVVGFQRMQLFAEQLTTSGTFKDFPGIPSWAKRITMMLNGVSTSGTSLVQLQAGSGSVQSSGYTSSVITPSNGAATVASTSTTGFLVSGNSSAADARTGCISLVNISGNNWICSGTAAPVAANASIATGSASLSGPLDRIRLTTVNGTDTFDAGSVSILVEGYA